jgi:general stress protein 26
MQPNNGDLLFLKEKIEEIKIALFKTDTDSLLQLPNNIISTLKVDDDGCIWFFTSCVKPYAHHLEKELYVSLHYYRKENNCRLFIRGKAFIEKDDGDSASENSFDKIILLKTKIQQAEYFESRTFSKVSIREKIKFADRSAFRSKHS